MMKNLSFTFLLILCGTFPIPAGIYAQDSRAFSGETDLYPAELAAYIQKNVNSESQAALNNFLTMWTVDSLFNKEEQEKIVSTSLALIRKNAKPHPHFTHYLNCIVTLKN